MKLVIIISTSDPETVFNALRLGNFALKIGDQVNVFLLGKGVELETIAKGEFPVFEQVESLLASGGTILACESCIKLRTMGTPGTCSISSISDLYQLIQDADRVVSF